MNDKYINLVLNLARKAYKKGDFPVGAIIIKNNHVISKAYNRKEKDRNAIKHAEIIAISKACKKLKTWHLEDCTLFCTMEPCAMCTGAIIQSRVKKIVYFVQNNNFGAIESKFNILDNSKIEIVKIENSEYEKIIKEFFKNKRR